MAIHPLGLLDWDKGEPDRQIIAASLADLERLGTDFWCGYSYSWLGNMWARARNGEKAASALRIFATCFCLPNSFHVNGDQSGTGKSKFTYRPFTLEGNFAFAAGLQEMLLQSQGGILRLFPAIPSSWKEASFRDFRAEGAFLVTAAIRAGSLDSVRILPEKDARLRMLNPFSAKTLQHQRHGPPRRSTKRPDPYDERTCGKRNHPSEDVPMTGIMEAETNTSCVGSADSARCVFCQPSVGQYAIPLPRVHGPSPLGNHRAIIHVAKPADAVRSDHTMAET